MSLPCIGHFFCLIDIQINFQFIDDERGKVYSQKKKEYWAISLLLFLFGITCFIVGFHKFFYSEATFGIHIRYFQPIVINGGKEVIIGILFLIITLYRLLKYRKLIRQTIELDIEEVSPKK